MAVKKRGLGRGLDALLAGSVSAEEPAVAVATTVEPDKADGYQLLPVACIQRGKYQPRREMAPEALTELADSIRVQGVMQPIVVRPVGNDRYEIIAGERRWRASKQAELDTIPAVIRDVPDEAAIAMALIENIQREDLNPIEEATALARLQQEFELTQQQVADAVGKSRSAVANLLRLMNLGDDVRKMLEFGDIEMGHARCLLPLDAEQQKALADEVVAGGLSVRETEALARAAIDGKPEKKRSSPVPENSAALDQQAGELSRKYETAVKIARNASGKGRITLSFDSDEALQALLQRLA